jgi:hypothetical protein
MSMTWSVLAVGLLGLEAPREEPSRPPLNVEIKVTGEKSATTDPLLGPLSSLAPGCPKCASPAPANLEPSKEVWNLSLPEAIRIAIENCETIKVITGGVGPAGTARSRALPSQVVISPHSAEVSAWRFKAEVMAHVRSIEQQYWNLAHQQIQLRAAEKVSEQARAILEREKAELTVGAGTVADVAEAQQRLEQFNLDLVTRTSDVITTERQLRNILGLPAADNRRIVTTSAAMDDHLEFDWNLCLREMNNFQPDVVQSKLNVLMPKPLALGSQRDKDKSGQSQQPEEQARQLHDVQQVIHQQTHSLARFFLEVDANYKQFKTTSQLRKSAAERLEAQRAYYEEGRITIDRLLDAASQYAAAVAQEAQFKSAYNISIVGLQEAKGTLLADRGIIVAEVAHRPKVVATRKEDEHARTASFDPAAEGRQRPQPRFKGPSETKQAGAGESSSKAEPETRTWKFSVSIGGANPLKIDGTITPGSKDRPASPQP